MATLITDEAHDIEATVVDGRMLLSPGALAAATGWELKPEGLCRDDMCVPVRDRAALESAGLLDLRAVAAALLRPIVIDAAGGVAAMALPREGRRRALSDQQAPPFTLPDLEGNARSSEEWRGRKKLLMAFSSW